MDIKKLWERVERKRGQPDPVGNLEGFEKTVETLTAIESAITDTIKSLSLDEPNFVQQVDEAYDKALREEAGLSLAFVRERLRPLFDEAREDWDRSGSNDQDDLVLIGEFLYFRNTHPDSTEDDLIQMTSDALNGERDEESWERINLYTVLVFAQAIY